MAGVKEWTATTLNGDFESLFSEEPNEGGGRGWECCVEGRVGSGRQQGGKAVNSVRFSSVIEHSGLALASLH